jgi:hypothetical protein
VAEKLYIYDSSSRLDRMQAAGRFSGVAGVETLAAGSIADLHKGLAALVAKKSTFKRALFQTHGYSGMIAFNGDAIRAGDLRTDFTGKGYERLFPHKAKIYFDGCDVARDAAGWEFLVAAGQAFLRSAGGITLGYTWLGTAMPGWLPFVGGHTEHFAGHLRIVEFAAGGVESNRFDSDGSLPDLVRQATILSSY